MKNTDSFDKDLNPVLEIASNEELEPLIGYLEPKLSNSLKRSHAYIRYQPDHTKYADLIAKEIRDMGGNSIANLARGLEGPSYHEIVCDVAKKLKAPYNKEREIEAIENSILETILTQALEKMTEEEKNDLAEEMKGFYKVSKGQVTTYAFLQAFKAGGFQSYQLSVMIANYIAKAILGRGITFAGNAMLTKTLSLAMPAMWAATTVWTVVDIASPSLKVTIPSVVHIAMLRKKHLVEV